MPVFNPDDIEAIRAETAQPKPFPVGKRVEGKGPGSPVRQVRVGIDLLAQLLADRISIGRGLSLWSRRFF